MTITVKDAAGDTQTINTVPNSGQTTAAASRSVVLASDHPSVPITTTLKSVTVEFIRPSDITAYADRDVIGNTGSAALIEFGSVFAANGGTAYLVKVQLFTDQKDCVAPTRLYLFNAAITPIADNSPFTPLYADLSKAVGYVDIPALAREGSSSTTAQAIWTGQMEVEADAADVKLFGVLVAKAGFPPASAQKWSVRISVDRN